MANPGPASSSVVNLVQSISNIQKRIIASITLSPSAVAANTTAEQTFTSTGSGIMAGDYVSINKPTAQAGLGIVGARGVGTDQFAITFVNATAAPITPTAAEVYLVSVERLISGAALIAFPY